MYVDVHHLHLMLSRHFYIKDAIFEFFHGIPFMYERLLLNEAKCCRAHCYFPSNISLTEEKLLAQYLSSYMKSAIAGLKNKCPLKLNAKSLEKELTKLKFLLFTEEKIWKIQNFLRLNTIFTTFREIFFRSNYDFFTFLHQFGRRIIYRIQAGVLLKLWSNLGFLSRSN